MRKLSESYVHGASTVPLIGDTIGAHFDEAAARWADRDALIARHQNIRWTYARAEASASTPSPPGCWRWASSRATASASGRPTTPNGC